MLTTLRLVWPCCFTTFKLIRVTVPPSTLETNNWAVLPLSLTVEAHGPSKQIRVGVRVGQRLDHVAKAIDDLERARPDRVECAVRGGDVADDHEPALQDAQGLREAGRLRGEENRVRSTDFDRV